MPDTRHPTPDALLQVPSVALFVDRAQAVVPDFQVTKRNAEAVAALCRRLEGLPLAIELAAARVGVVTPAQMLQRLPDAHVGAHEGGGRGRFELLRSRQRPADVRHQSLWMALDWSFQLLLPEVQRCFARLSVFQGGFTLAAATAVCGEPGYPRSGWTLDFLQLLRECSLIQGEGGEPEIRFRLLETLREFGAEQLSEQERQDLARQHARYYLELSEEATPKLRCAEQAEWQARLEREHDNLRAALQWSVDRGPIDLVLPATGEAQALSARPDSSRRDTGLRLSGALAWFWHLRGHWGEGRRWLELALAPSLGGGVPPADRGLVATALHGAGLLAFDQCDYEAARTCCEQSSAIWRERHDPWHLAASLIILAEVASARGDYATARPHAEEGLLISRRLGDPWALASALSARAGLAWEEGDYPAARAFGVESVAVWRQLRMPSGAAAALARLGDVAGVEGDHLRGRAAYEESLALSRETGDQHGIADALRRLGCAAIGQEASEAPALIQEALAMFRDLGDRFCTAASLYDLARAVRAQGDWEATRAYFAESLVVRKEAGIPLGAAASLEGLATVARARNQPEQALRWLGAAQALRRAIGARSSSGFQRWVDGQLAALRDALGEGAFTASWEAGQALTLEQAAAEALSDAW